MITTKLYQDERHTKGSEQMKAPIKVVISKRGTTALISTEIKLLPSEWDKKAQKVINNENAKKLNIYLSKFKIKVESILMDLEDSGKLAGLSASKIKSLVMEQVHPKELQDETTLFVNRFIQFAESKITQRTKEIYLTTLKRINEYDLSCYTKTFEDIDKRWLNGFDRYLSKTSPSQNARNIHLRNIRAVFNDAIDDEITTSYPFRKFKLSYEPTAKRSLTISQIRDIFSLEMNEAQQEYVDVFKLIFLLCGINIVDLFNLTDKNIINGRLEYIRAKTHKRYSIKLEPEALELLLKHKGKRKLLDIADRYKDYNDYKSTLNKNLKKVGFYTEETYKHSNIKIMQPIEPKLSTYWARHTWATIAAELDIPKETIAAGLGHNIGSPITSIYIDFNMKKVDEANRKIIDYIYNKV